MLFARLPNLTISGDLEMVRLPSFPNQGVGVERSEMTQKLHKLEKERPPWWGVGVLLILHDVIISYSCPSLGVFAPKLVSMLVIWN